MQRSTTWLNNEPTLRTLRKIEQGNRWSLSDDEVGEIMADFGVTDPVSETEALLEYGVFQRDESQDLRLTEFGARATIVLDALHGTDLDVIMDRLRRVLGTPSTYSVVREGMTKAFIANLAERPIEGPVYICSPWISFAKKTLRQLQSAVLTSNLPDGRALELLVVTRPDRQTGTAPESIRPLVEMGAKVYLQKRLHSKLYIREPGPSGGYLMGIVGSQNMTKSHYLELGIMVEADSQMIRTFVREFLRVTLRSVEFC